MCTFAVILKNMNFYTQEQMVDKHVGAKGTPARDEYDEQVELMLVGDAIRKARQAQSLSQEQLGEMVGVQKAQISRLKWQESDYFHYCTVIQSS